MAGESSGSSVARCGEAQPPEGASVKASVSARWLSGLPRRAGVSLQRGSSLRPPCPAGGPSPCPLAPPRRPAPDAPAEQAAAASWGARARAARGAELSSAPGRPRRSPRGHALSNFAAAARGKEGGARGCERRPGSAATMPQLGGGGGCGSGSGAAGGGDDLGASDELIPFQDEGGEEQEPSSDSASAQRDLDEVKSSLVNESENQSSSSDSEAERRPQPARDSFQKPRDYFAE
ncbi:Hypothetical predicted protein, partial [Marmota monax]